MHQQEHVANKSSWCSDEREDCIWISTWGTLETTFFMVFGIGYQRGRETWCHNSIKRFLGKSFDEDVKEGEKLKLFEKLGMISKGDQKKMLEVFFDRERRLKIEGVHTNRGSSHGWESKWN